MLTNRSLLTAFLLLGLAAPAARASTIEYTSAAAFAAVTTNPAVVGFNGILPAGTPYEGFNPLIVGSMTFTEPDTGVFVDVTTANFYSPGYPAYPADFIVNSGNPGPDNHLLISFPATYALGLDFGGLFSGGANTILLSNGFTVSEGSSPTIPNTEFRGFVSSDPITSLNLTLTNDNWVVQDVVTATPVPEPASLLLLGTGLIGIGRRWRWAKRV